MDTISRGTGFRGPKSVNALKGVEPLSIRDLITYSGHQPLVYLAVFLGLPLGVLILGILHKGESSTQCPWKYIYGFLVYLSCLPGIISSVLVAYTLFFTKENLLDVNFYVYLLPLVSMVLTLSLIRRRLNFNDIPGFGRLSALMALLAVSFALALAVDKTRIFVGFFGSIDRLLLLMAGLFAFIKISFWMLFGRKKIGSSKD